MYKGVLYLPLLVNHWIVAQTGVPDIRLKGIDNKPFSISSVQQHRAIVFILVNHECPITQQYMPLLAALYARYQEKKVAFYGIFPPSGYKHADLQQFRKQYAVPFPLLMDTKRGKCIRWLQATVTPEVFLVDSTGRVLYRGAIDNQFYALGKRRAAVTEHYLADALEAALINEEIKVKQTQPLGCLIEPTNR